MPIEMKLCLKHQRLNLKFDHEITIYSGYFYGYEQLKVHAQLSFGTLFLYIPETFFVAYQQNLADHGSTVLSKRDRLYIRPRMSSSRPDTKSNYNRFKAFYMLKRSLAMDTGTYY